MDIRGNSKKYYMTTDVVLHLWSSKDKSFLLDLFNEMYEELPAPKAKKKK